MLLGNNTFDWLMCPLHVNVISALQSAMPWYLTNLSSMGTGDRGLEGRGRGFPIPGWATQTGRAKTQSSVCWPWLWRYRAQSCSHRAVCSPLLIPYDLMGWLEEWAGQRGGKLCFTSACWFVPVCSSPQWDHVEPKFREALFRNKADGEFWYFPIDPSVYQVFCSHSLWKKEPFRQFSALSDDSRHAVLAVCKQQIGGCPDPMVSEETRPGEMELAKIK